MAIVRNVHPRVGLTAANLATFQARIAGSHSGYWSSLVSWCNGKLGEATSYWAGKEPEYSVAFAFAYALDPTKTSFGTKARDIALYLANLSLPSETYRRHYSVAMALLLDWAWDRFSDSERTTVRTRIAAYIDTLRNRNAVEFLWGHAHGNNSHAIAALPAILEDGSSAENTTWDSWLSDLLDCFDNGGNDCFFAGFRYFGDTDGGSHKGCGPAAYLRASEWFYKWAMMSATALGETWTAEPWWIKTGHWYLWHWRGDRTFHRRGENLAYSQYHYDTQFHLWEIANAQNNDYGKACQWLAAEIGAVNNYAAWGPYHLHSILKHNTGRVATKPTIANQGGYEMKLFAAVGEACFRAGWETTDPSLVFSVPKTFTGGHSQRDAGAIWIARSKPLVVSHGRYDPNQVKTYRVVGSPTDTGHRYSYYARSLAFSTIQIYDSDEVAENVKESFQRLASQTSSRFGVWNGSSVDVSNDGGQLWPKGFSDSQYQPDDIGDVLAESEYQFDTVREEVHGTKYEYLVGDLTPWFYSAKVTKVRRHVLWVKRGQIPGWNYPVALVFDDIVSHVDATAGKYTQRILWQSQVQPTGTSSAFQVDRSPDRIFFRVLTPTIERVVKEGYLDHDSVVYVATGGSSEDDSVVGVYRTEINPASSGTTQQFLTVVFPCADSESSPPSLSLILDASWIGATIGGVDCKMALGDTHSAVVGDSGDTTPPAAPTGLGGTAGNQSAALDWDDNSEGDLDHYEVFRRNVL